MGENLVSVRINDQNGRNTDVWGLTQDENNFICIKKNNAVIDMISGKERLSAQKAYFMLKRKIEKTKASENRFYIDEFLANDNYYSRENDNYHKKNNYNRKNNQNNNRSNNNNYNKKGRKNSNGRNKGYRSYQDQ